MLQQIFDVLAPNYKYSENFQTFASQTLTGTYNVNNVNYLNQAVNFWLGHNPGDGGGERPPGNFFQLLPGHYLSVEDQKSAWLQFMVLFLFKNQIPLFKQNGLDFFLTY